MADYATPELRRALLNELRSRDYAYAGMICAAEPVMNKWIQSIGIPLTSCIFNPYAVRSATRGTIANPLKPALQLFPYTPIDQYLLRVNGDFQLWETYRWQKAKR